MKKKDVIAYYGSAANTAQYLRTDPSNVSRWPDKVPRLWASLLHVCTRGTLEYRERDYPLPRFDK